MVGKPLNGYPSIVEWTIKTLINESGIGKISLFCFTFFHDVHIYIIGKEIVDRKVSVVLGM